MAEIPSEMGAAQVSELGKPPQLGRVATPAPAPDEVLVEVVAAALNPVTLSTASGVFYGGHPPLPYTPGAEGVGRVLGGAGIPQGARVRFEASESRGGAIAEYCAVRAADCVPLPEGLGDSLAAGLGVAGLAAWLSLRDAVSLRPGERVLILGATGAVGQIAVQLARIMGAGRIVAAGRNRQALERCRALGADQVVALDDLHSVEEMDAALTTACEGPPEVVFDPVFGIPSSAASRACGMGARIVNLGQSAGAEATYRSRDIRGKLLTIKGHASGAYPSEVRRQAFQELAEHAAAGRIRLAVEEFALSDIAAAWARQGESPHGKVVIRPR